MNLKDLIDADLTAVKLLLDTVPSLLRKRAAAALRVGDTAGAQAHLRALGLEARVLGLAAECDSGWLSPAVGHAPKGGDSHRCVAGSRLGPGSGPNLRHASARRGGSGNSPCGGRFARPHSSHEGLPDTELGAGTGLAARRMRTYRLFLGANTWCCFRTTPGTDCRCWSGSQRLLRAAGERCGCGWRRGAGILPRNSANCTTAAARLRRSS